MLVRTNKVLTKKGLVEILNQISAFWLYGKAKVEIKNNCFSLIVDKKDEEGKDDWMNGTYLYFEKSLNSNMIRFYNLQDKELKKYPLFAYLNFLVANEICSKFDGHITDKSTIFKIFPKTYNVATDSYKISKKFLLKKGMSDEQVFEFVHHLSNHVPRSQELKHDWVNMFVNKDKIKLPDIDIAKYPAFKDVYLAYYDCLEDEEDDNAWEYKSAIRDLSFISNYWISPAEAKQILSICCVGYNEFDYQILDLFPDDSSICISRQGSVCLFVRKGNKKIPSQNKIGCDEYDLVTADIPNSVIKQGDYRLWWD